MKLLDNSFTNYYFYDLNARLTHTFSQKDKIFFSFYKGEDNIHNNNGNTATNGITEIITDNSNQTSGWGNFISSLRWNHTFGNSLFANTTIAYSSYDYFTQEQDINTDKKIALNSTKVNNYLAKYTSNISDLIMKTDFEYSLSNHQKIMFGAGNTFHAFRPGQNIFNMDNQELNEKADTSYTNAIIHASELYIYVEDEIKPTQKLTINAGLRISGLISDSVKNFNPEPRLSVNYLILPQLAIKTGYSRMVQYMHLLSSSGLSLPTDLWVPALKGLQPLKSDQVNVGLAYDWAKIALLSIEAYRKWLTNTTDLLNGASLTDITPWYEKTTQGHGNTKGLEISIEKQQGRLTGSINYTLSSAVRTYAALNNGQTFPFQYDRRHDFNISANYQITSKWDLSAMWLYGSGYPVTIPVDRYYPALGISNVIYYYPLLNNYRLPAYHRLDLGLHYKTKNRLGVHTLSFDVFNAYNRKNPVNMYYNGWVFTYAYLLPRIPSITYTLKF